MLAMPACDERRYCEPLEMKPETLRIRFCGGSWHNRMIRVPGVGSPARNRVFVPGGDTYVLRKFWRNRGLSTTIFYEYHLEGTDAYLHSGDDFDGLFDCTFDIDQPCPPLSFAAVKSMWDKLK